MTEKCVCSHTRKAHGIMNQKAWDRFHKQLSGYEEKKEGDRVKFWIEFFTVKSDDEWKCGTCSKCESFKLDNLQLIEDLTKERKLI